MEFRMIKYFLQLCEDLNFTVAAKKLYITQQALSKAIRNLENELGVQLFNREVSGLTLTKCGEHFRRTIGPVMEKLDEAVEETKQMLNFNQVTIRFGYTYGTASVMQQLIKNFEMRNPQVAILGEERTDLQCENGLHSGNYDIICITEPSEPVDAISIYEEPVVLAVSMGGPFDRDLTAEMLINNVLIDGGDEFNVSLKLREAFKRRGLNLVMKGASLDKTAFVDFIRKGQCVLAITQHSSFTKNIGFVTKSLPFEENEVMWRLCVRTGKEASASDTARDFVDFLSRSFQQFYLDFFNDN